MRTFITSFIILFLFCGFVFSQEAALQVEQMDICTAVEDRQPVGVDTSFSTEVERVFCFTKIIGAEDTTKISHVWYYNDKEMARLELPVKYKSWRTWSSKRIIPEWTGDWRVEILSDAGTVLASKTFKVK